MSQDSLIRLQCQECKNYNYHTHRNLRRPDSHKLALSKHCRICRKHTAHAEKAKK